MNAEQARAFLLALAHVVETAQWGGIVFRVGDKAIGGKMFAMINLEAGPPMSFPISWAAGQQRYADLLEREGIRPAPYLARAYWVSAERWTVLRSHEWQEQLRLAHETIHGRLPGKVKTLLEQPAPALKRHIAERRRLLAAKSTKG